MFKKRLLRNVYEDYESSYDELHLKSKLATLEVQRYRFIDFNMQMSSKQGISEELINDNGPCYDSDEFRKLARNWDFEIKTSSPTYAQSSGLAEISAPTHAPQPQQRHDETQLRQSQVIT